MAYITGTYFAPISRQSGRNYKSVGYWLSSQASTGALKCHEQAFASEIRCRLDDHCHHHGCILNAVEMDNGSSTNPMRMGLWRALRRLVCDKCTPKNMPFSVMDLDDFLTQALSPCQCGRNTGLEGIIVTSLNHLCNDKSKVSQIALRLAEKGKHLIAEDGICLSCCHPSTKQMLQRKKLLIAS